MVSRKSPNLHKYPQTSTNQTECCIQVDSGFWLLLLLLPLLPMLPVLPLLMLLLLLLLLELPIPAAAAAAAAIADAAAANDACCRPCLG